MGVLSKIITTGVKQAVEELLGPATEKIGSIGVYE